MDPDPGWDLDPATFVIDLQDANKKTNLKKSFSADYFLKVYLHHFSQIKSPNKSQNSRNQGFSYYFCLMRRIREVQKYVDPVDSDPDSDPDPEPCFVFAFLTMMLALEFFFRYRNHSPSDTGRFY
jgi:hypothetical protein